MKGYIPLFFDTFEETQDLSDEEFGRLIRAVGAYATGNGNWATIIKGNEKFAFPFLRGQVDRNAEISKARAKAGSSRKNQQTAETETNENKTEQTETNSAKKEKNEKEEENKNENKNESKNNEEAFARFWTAYPRKEARQAAKEAFERLRPSADLQERMLNAIDRWKTTDQWRENGGQFVPHPAKWLNERRWEDELPAAGPGKKAVIAQQYKQRRYSVTEETPEETIKRLAQDFPGVLESA